MRSCFAGPLGIMATAILAASVHGQEQREQASEAELRALENQVDTFLAEFENPDVGPSLAVREFVRSSPLEKRGEPLEKLIQQAGRLKDSYGKFTEHELVSVKSFGKDVVVLRYLLKAEQFPIVWHFYFYRPPKSGTTMLDSPKFTLIELRFDTNLDVLDR